MPVAQEKKSVNAESYGLVNSFGKIINMPGNFWGNLSSKTKAVIMGGAIAGLTTFVQWGLHKYKAVNQEPHGGGAGDFGGGNGGGGGAPDGGISFIDATMPTLVALAISANSNDLTEEQIEEQHALQRDIDTLRSSAGEAQIAEAAIPAEGAVNGVLSFLYSLLPVNLLTGIGGMGVDQNSVQTPAEEAQESAVTKTITFGEKKDEVIADEAQPDADDANAVEAVEPAVGGSVAEENKDSDNEAAAGAAVGARMVRIMVPEGFRIYKTVKGYFIGQNLEKVDNIIEVSDNNIIYELPFDEKVGFMVYPGYELVVVEVDGKRSFIVLPESEPVNDDEDENENQPVVDDVPATPEHTPEPELAPVLTPRPGANDEANPAESTEVEYDNNEVPGTRTPSPIDEPVYEPLGAADHPYGHSGAEYGDTPVSTPDVTGATSMDSIADYGV